MEKKEYRAIINAPREKVGRSFGVRTPIRNGHLLLPRALPPKQTAGKRK